MIDINALILTLKQFMSSVELWVLKIVNLINCVSIMRSKFWFSFFFCWPAQFFFEDSNINLFEGEARAKKRDSLVIFPKSASNVFFGLFVSKICLLHRKVGQNGDFIVI